MREEEEEEEERKKKEERRTRQQKQVPFHNRSHRTFLFFACVETFHSDKATGKSSRHSQMSWSLSGVAET